MSEKQRISRIYSQMNKQDIDALLITLPANITYLTGYISRDSWFLISKGRNFYITDSRYTLEAKGSLSRKFSVWQAENSLLEALVTIAKGLPIKKLGFEQKHLSAYTHDKLSLSFAGAIKLTPTQGMIEAFREIKTTPEVEKIEKATRIAVKALKFIKGQVKAGRREVEIAGEIERFIRYNGGQRASFEIIVASGPNSSYPHHQTSNRKIGKNEPVTIDMGVEYCGYKSDLTRIFFSGRINPLVRKVYDIVATAQRLAIKRIKPAVKISEVDLAARQYIAAKGYGGFFNHSLGHGVGLEVHESPRISSREGRRLEQGMVFTIEPAIYIPGEFGIRIEDMVLVTREGVKVLSGALNK